MSFPRYWRVLACLLALAVLSFSAGLLFGHRCARRQFEARRDLVGWNQHVTREFDALVRPDRAQAVRIQALLDRAVRELQAIRKDTITRSTEVIQRLCDAVDQELTPEQRRAFATMKPKPGELTLDVLKVEGKPAP